MVSYLRFNTHLTWLKRYDLIVLFLLPINISKTGGGQVEEKKNHFLGIFMRSLFSSVPDTFFICTCRLRSADISVGTCSFK